HDQAGRPLAAGIQERLLYLPVRSRPAGGARGLATVPAGSEREMTDGGVKGSAGELRALGRGIAPARTANLYASMHPEGPTDGVKVTIDIAYGPDARHRLDVYEPVVRPQHAMPVLIFIHGGGFVTGDKTEPNSPYYANIGHHFARRGVLTILATYRLAPQHTWARGAMDVAAAVKKGRPHVARLGGGAHRIRAMGHSAGGAPHAPSALERRR